MDKVFITLNQQQFFDYILKFYLSLFSDDPAEAALWIFKVKKIYKVVFNSNCHLEI